MYIIITEKLNDTFLGTREKSAKVVFMIKSGPRLKYRRKIIKYFCTLCLAGFIIVLFRTFYLYPGSSLDGSGTKQSHLTLAEWDTTIKRSGALQRLQEALRFQTISHGNTEIDDSVENKKIFEKFQNFLDEKYPQIRKTYSIERIEKWNRLIHLTGVNPSLPPVVFLTHMDVVPAGDEKAWTRPPFSGDDFDGHIWGRGAIDDKGRLIAIYEALEILAAQKFTPKRSIYIGSGHDEEIGGNFGAAQMASFLKKKHDRIAAVFDEGNMIIQDLVPGITRPVAMIGIAQKGYATAYITARAPGGHSSMPTKESAIAKLSGVADYIHKNQFPVRWQGVAEQFFSALTPHMNLGRRMAFANLWLFSPLIFGKLSEEPGTNALIRTTTALTMIQAGIKENILPDQARLVVNFRMHPEDDKDSVKKYIERICSKFNVECSWNEKIFHQASSTSSPDSDLYNLTKITTQQVYPEAIVVPALMVASTDSVHFKDFSENIYRNSPILIQKSDLKLFHGVDERLSYDQFSRLVQFYYTQFKSL